MVPCVKEHTASSSSTPATTATGQVTNSGSAPPPTLTAPHPIVPVPSHGSMGSTSAPSTPNMDKKEGTKTLKGFNFKDAKEKMMRKKGKEKDSSSNLAASKNRKSLSLAASDELAQRRRSSTNGVGSNVVAGDQLGQLRTMLGQHEAGEMSSSAGKLTMSGGSAEDAFPGVRQVVVSSGNEVRVEATKDCMAAGPLSPDVREGDVLLCVRCDNDGNAEVMIRNQPHLVPLSCLNVLPIDNPSAEQKHLIAELTKKNRFASNTLTRKGTGGRKDNSVLGNLRSKMRGSDKEDSSSGPSSNMSSPKDTSPISDDMQDEKLNAHSVFGKPLSANETPIPGPVRKCVEFFRRNGNIKYEGIFRVPGSSNAVMRIRNRFLVGGNGQNIPDDTNPTVVASALKTFLFELPEPLFPDEHWYALMEITDSRDFGLTDAHNLIDALPSENGAVLHYLFDFLAEVSEYASDNKMTPANLGMVFGIVLIRPPDNNVSNVGSSMPKEVCTFFVEHVDEIFNDEESSSE